MINAERLILEIVSFGESAMADECDGDADEGQEVLGLAFVAAVESPTRRFQRGPSSAVPPAVPSRTSTRRPDEPQPVPPLSAMPLPSPCSSAETSAAGRWPTPCWNRSGSAFGSAEPSPWSSHVTTAAGPQA